MTDKKKHRMGDVREDGLVFIKYRHERGGEEYWSTRDIYEKQLARSRKYGPYHRDTKRRYQASRKQSLGKYGINEDVYADMLARQGGLCAICEKPETVPHTKGGKVRRLAVDHCHKTGIVRGLLCMKCNKGLGLLMDDAAIIRKAADYLEKPGCVAVEKTA